MSSISKSRKLDLLLLGDSSATLGWGRYAGIYRIASEVRAAGFTVKTIDHFISIFSNPQLKKQLQILILDTKPRFVGISSTFLKRYFSAGRPINEVFVEYCSEVEVRPFGIEDSEIYDFLDWLHTLNIRVIVGGSEPVSLFKNYPVDYFIVGQGEVSVLEVLRKNEPVALAAKTLYQDDYKYNNFNRSTIDWSHEDSIFAGESLPIELARGCIFKCSFCNFQLNGKMKNEFVKMKSVLIEELLRNYELFGTTSYMISDDLLNDSLEKVRMIYEISEELPFRLSFTSYLRLDMLWRYPEMIPLLKKAGLKACYFGIETFHDQAGRSVGKGLGARRIKETLEKIKKDWGKEVWISAGLIVGLPFEGLKSCQTTIDWMLQPASPVDFFKISPLIVFNSDQANHQVFGQRASSLGYQIEDGKYYSRWSNAEMSFFDAIEFCQDFYKSVEGRVWKYAHFCTYNRIRNLGYVDNDQILSQVYSDLESRQASKIQTYLSKALTMSQIGTLDISGLLEVKL